MAPHPRPHRRRPPPKSTDAGEASPPAGSAATGASFTVYALCKARERSAAGASPSATYACAQLVGGWYLYLLCGDRRFECSEKPRNKELKAALAAAGADPDPKGSWTAVAVDKAEQRYSTRSLEEARTVMAGLLSEAFRQMVHAGPVEWSICPPPLSWSTASREQFVLAMAFLQDALTERRAWLLAYLQDHPGSRIGLSPKWYADSYGAAILVRVLRAAGHHVTHLPPLVDTTEDELNGFNVILSGAVADAPTRRAPPAKAARAVDAAEYEELAAMLLKPTSEWSVLPIIPGVTVDQIRADARLILTRCWRTEACTCPVSTTADDATLASCPGAHLALHAGTLELSCSAAMNSAVVAQLLTGQSSAGALRFHGWKKLSASDAGIARIAERKAAESKQLACDLRRDALREGQRALEAAQAAQVSAADGSVGR